MFHIYMYLLLYFNSIEWNLHIPINFPELDSKLCHIFPFVDLKGQKLRVEEKLVCQNVGGSLTY